MNNKIIIVEGYLASGKSTFALKLSESLTIPYFIKDTFKIALCENISVNDEVLGGKNLFLNYEKHEYRNAETMKYYDLF